MQYECLTCGRNVHTHREACIHADEHGHYQWLDYGYESSSDAKVIVVDGVSARHYGEKV